MNQECHTATSVIFFLDSSFSFADKAADNHSKAKVFPNDYILLVFGVSKHMVQQRVIIVQQWNMSRCRCVFSMTANKMTAFAKTAHSTCVVM